MPSVVIGIAVVVSPQIERILRSEDADIGLEVERKEAAIGNLVNSMAPSVIGLQLQRREPAGFIVISLVPSFLAISLFSRPETTSGKTSRSRGVSESKRCLSTASCASR